MKKNESQSNSWQLLDGKLRREFIFADFPSAIAFVNKVAEVAESKNHHPDIIINYNKVTLELWTHTEGKVTGKDYEFAENMQNPD